MKFRAVIDKIKEWVKNCARNVNAFFVTTAKKTALMIKGREPYDYFCALMCFSFVIFIITVLFCGVLQFSSLFFLNGADLGMDFFNSIRDVSHGYRYLYEEANVIYPPLANLFFLFVSRFISADYNLSTWEDRLAWTSYPSAIIVYTLFFLITFIILVICMPKIAEMDKSKRLLFLFFFIFNVPTLYGMERGNIIILSNICVLTYLLTYSSDNNVKREIGLLALAIALAIKIYPAAFGWFLVNDKRYKEIGRLIIYSLLLFIVPSFFFGGPFYCVRMLFRNIFSFSDGASDDNVTTLTLIGENVSLWFSRHTGANKEKVALVLQKFVFITDKLHTAFSLILIILFVFGSFVIKKRWKSVMIACTALLSLPSIKALYLWPIFFAPLIMIMKEEKINKSNFIPFFAMILPFVYLPKLPVFSNFAPGQTTNNLVMSICISVLIATSIVIMICEIVNYFKNKNCDNAGADKA